ncbi:hypothetical protein ES288_D01G119600v1 [Gossypium darwinii]|uniref:Uncharacterized protein n=1 Tax=Gossypium darwinii TaxID=34276 RepID=A0A5D2DP35_GOSDA|nr:hypothetical protein ES288_D01G119600v1 [Gossypium darwinii]
MRSSRLSRPREAVFLRFEAFSSFATANLIINASFTFWLTLKVGPCLFDFTFHILVPLSIIIVHLTFHDIRRIYYKIIRKTRSINFKLIHPKLLLHFHMEPKLLRR